MGSTFEIGDRVIGIGSWDGNGRIDGVPGVVLGIGGGDVFCVKYDEDIGGHDLNGQCEDGYGWKTGGSSLAKYTPPQAVITISYDEVMQ